MPRKFADYSRTYIYQLTCKNTEVSDLYISYTTNLTQRKYKHKRETLDNSYHTKLYDCIRKNGGWTNWKCNILEECVCINEIQAKDMANYYIIKMKPNLNDEKLDETLINETDRVQGNPNCKPNIFADETSGLSHLPSLDRKIPTEIITNKGKYVCLCKKSYAHRSSYYKHTSTCLQFQHKQSSAMHNLAMGISSTNNISVSIISTTMTTTSVEAKLPNTISERLEEAESTHNNIREDDDDSMEIVRYRFKSKKTAEKKDNDIIFDYLNVTEPEISIQICEKPEIDKHSIHYDSDSSSSSSSSSASSSVMDDITIDMDTDTDNISAMSSATDDATTSAVSQILTEQNEKLTDYIRKMISALTDGKKRNKKSLVNSLVFELLDQNKTLQKQIVELSKERNIIVNNTNNNQFNLNFFLNEQCKDAVNISDFVDSLEITMDDLTYTRNQGLVEGISKVMIDGLKQMDLYKRPIHCTDQKRDTIYVRDNHQWARDEGNARMRQAFIDIANKEYFAIKKWMDLHPGWETNSKLQDFHHKMVKNVLHEIKDDPIGERKIMKSIEREIFIEK